MLGNDIVDLQKAALESNWKRKGYLEKVFTANERLAITSSLNPNTMVWLFWSMKEAVYKIVNRATLDRFYAPQKFECELNINEIGTVIYKTQTYYTQTSITADYVHTIATADCHHLKNIQILFLANTEDYVVDFNSTSPNLTLKKNEFNHPYFFVKASESCEYASISHHGKYLVIIHGIDSLAKPALSSFIEQ